VIDVSVIIPTYNRAHLIGAAIESALGPGVEVIVVDDGSTDGTLALLEQYDVQVIRSPGREKHHRARNRGLEAASSSNSSTPMTCSSRGVSRPRCGWRGRPARIWW
jgi:glycosyltransferase involved in cell wall biosynthesis